MKKATPTEKQPRLHWIMPKIGLVSFYNRGINIHKICARYFSCINNECWCDKEVVVWINVKARPSGRD